MPVKTLMSRVVNKHATEQDWNSSSFTPLQGEIVVYDIDDNYTYERFKIGDGVHTVNELPFNNEMLEDAILASIADWNQNDSDALDYVKNRTHYDARYQAEININYDGTLTGYESNHVSLEEVMVKVSDTPIEAEELVGSVIIYLGKNTMEHHTVGSADFTYDGKNFYIRDYILVVHEDKGSYTKGVWFKRIEDNIAGALYPSKLAYMGTVGELKQLDEKYLPDSVFATPDWNQNDETALDYVKNRTHYEETTSNPLVIAEGPYTGETSDGLYFQWENLPRGFVAGERVTVILRDGIGGDEEITITGVAEQNGDFSYIPIERNLHDKYIYGISCNPDTAPDANGFTIYIAADFHYAKIILPDVLEEKNVIHQLDSKYIKDMYYDNGIVETEIVPELTFGSDEWVEGYFHSEISDFTPNMLQEGDTYLVTWNGETYTCLARSAIDGSVYIGNQTLAYDESLFPELIESSEPFFILTYEPDAWSFARAELGRHTFSIVWLKHDINQIDTKYLPVVEKRLAVVFDEELLDTNNFFDPSYKKLVGECRVTFNGVSEIVEFVDSGNYSYANMPFESLSYMETGNGQYWFDIAVDGEQSYTVKIEAPREFIKHEYLPVATDDEILELLMTEDMLPVVKDSDNSILADENNNILLW